MNASESIAALRLQLQYSQDLKSVKLNNGHFEVELLYYSSLCDEKIIHKFISEPYLRSNSIKVFRNVIHTSFTSKSVSPENVLDKLLLGNVAIVLEQEVYTVLASEPVSTKQLDPMAETTIQGPQTAFSEDLDTNLKIIREKYPQPTLLAEEGRVGTASRTKYSIVYDRKKADMAMVRDIKQKLEQVQADVIQSAAQLESLITARKYRLFPVMMLTERPDRTVFNLTQGKVVILLQGTPFTLVAPAVFYDFVSAIDDYYQSYFITRSLVILRYIGLILTLTMPAAYIAIVSYNPEIFRVQFTLSIAGSRAAVPYPSYVEVFIMLFMIEALIEASIRLPRYIGPTATTVGGLILGQSAQQAGLVSSIMIIITSVVAIANFVIPINEMSFALRVAKYPLILFTIFLGFFGLIAGLFIVMLYLSSIESFGKPYLRMFLNEATPSGYKDGGKN